MNVLLGHRLRQKQKIREREIIQDVELNPEGYGQEKNVRKRGRVAIMVTIGGLLPIVLQLVIVLVEKYIGDFKYIEPITEIVGSLTRWISFPLLVPLLIFWVFWFIRYLEIKEDEENFENLIEKNKR